MRLRGKGKEEKEDEKIEINRNIVYWAKILITAAILISLISFMAVRKEVKMMDKDCVDCTSVEQCEDWCSVDCLKTFRDHVTYSGYVNQTVKCNCICQSSVRLFIDNWKTKKSKERAI